MKAGRLFLYSAGTLLLVTGFAKLISSFGNGAILQTRDPLFGMKFGALFQFSSGVEMAIALICIFGKKAWFSSGSVAWLATSLLFYRIGMVLVGYHRPCSCMGNLTDALYISPETADIIAKVILAYLLVGSYTMLVWLWWQNHTHSAAIKSPKPALRADFRQD